MDWTIYDIPREGPATLETFRGGDTGATLLSRDIILSVEQLPDDQIRISSRIDFPPGLEDKRMLVVKRVGDKIRNMQASVSRLDKTIERIKDAVFVVNGKETPHLHHCEPDSRSVK